MHLEGLVPHERVNVVLVKLAALTTHNDLGGLALRIFAFALELQIRVHCHNVFAKWQNVNVVHLEFQTRDVSSEKVHFPCVGCD